MYIHTLSDVSIKDISIVGGKAVALGEMIQAGLPVPEGFVITIQAYQDFHNNTLSENFKNELIQAFDNLYIPRVAVRSSAIAEDSETISMAGQFESYLNVTRENLFEYIEKCWHSLDTERVKNYVQQNTIPKEQLMVAVIVQRMIDSEKSGVMFTSNPVTNNRNEIIIEAGYGLGELLVQGEITPDTYIIDKQKSQIVNKTLGNQQVMLVYQNNENAKIPVPVKNNFVLNEKEIKELSTLGVKIENYFTCPQDIEWAIQDEKYSILQSRPITTL